MTAKDDQRRKCNGIVQEQKMTPAENITAQTKKENSAIELKQHLKTNPPPAEVN